MKGQLLDDGAGLLRRNRSRRQHEQEKLGAEAYEQIGRLKRLTLYSQPAGSSRPSTPRSTGQCLEVVNGITIDTAQIGAALGLNLKVNIV